MNFYNLFLLLLVICTNQWNIHALNTESVLNGLAASQHNFKYHATILGKANFSNNIEIFCSGGLISKNLLLSSATCFLDNFGDLKPYSYFIAAGTNNIALPNGIRLLIEEIYIPKFDSVFEAVDISVSKLLQELVITPESLFSTLRMPILGNQYDMIHAFVAGCECLVGANNVSLKFIQVEILPESKWEPIVGNFFETMKSVGLKVARVDDNDFDLCETDAGAPVVVGRAVVGVALKVLMRDSPLGKLILYTDVFHARDFIYLTMQEELDTDQILVFQNNIHIL